MAVSKKMESDSYDRIEQSGKGVLDSVQTKTEGGNPQSNWESKLSVSCDEPYTVTVVSLKERNGRSGSQAGA